MTLESSSGKNVARTFQNLLFLSHVFVFSICHEGILGKRFNHPLLRRKICRSILLEEATLEAFH
jgi:hypothetical protein